MPREPPPWRGVRTIIDGKRAKLILDNDKVIADAVGKFKGGGYFDSNQKPKGEWVIATVRNRGTLPWYDSEFHPSRSVHQSMHVHHTKTSYDNPAPERLLVGYSRYTLKPVLASAEANATDLDLEVDGLSGLDLEVDFEGPLRDYEVILHHDLTVPENLRALKRLLIKKDWETAFAGGDITVEAAKSLAQESAQSLYHGRPPVVVARIKPPTTRQVPFHKKPDLGQCLNPDQLHGLHYRRFQGVLPTVLQHHSFNFAPCNFTYKAPYISNMRYPFRLYLDLAGFAKAHPLEKLNASVILFAVQLWVDIMASPTKCKEPYAEERVPEISLAVFLIYFEHWLKVHEYLQCIAYIHPFRFIDHMYAGDILRRDVHISKSSIDSNRVRYLVYEAKAIDPGISVDERMDLYPFMVNGTSMVQPQCLSEKFRMSPPKQALLGMPNPWILSHTPWDDISIRK